jgi:hypothetical protein
MAQPSQITEATLHTRLDQINKRLADSAMRLARIADSISGPRPDEEGMQERAIESVHEKLSTTETFCGEIEEELARLANSVGSNAKNITEGRVRG